MYINDVRESLIVWTRLQPTPSKNLFTPPNTRQWSFQSCPTVIVSVLPDSDRFSLSRQWSFQSCPTVIVSVLPDSDRFSLPDSDRFSRSFLNGNRNFSLKRVLYYPRAPSQTSLDFKRCFRPGWLGKLLNPPLPLTPEQCRGQKGTNKRTASPQNTYWSFACRTAQTKNGRRRISQSSSDWLQRES